jgi:hypothetical protein
MVSVVVLGLLLQVPWTAARAERTSRFAKLPGWAQQTLTLRRTVGAMQRQGRLRTAHPEVARQLSANLSKSLKRPVRIPASRIVQVEWGSAEHRALKEVLQPTIGVGIYPSRRWGHNKLRTGSFSADSVPGKARPFPSTGTKARYVPFDSMHKRFYEAVFAEGPAVVEGVATRARTLAGQKKDTGMGCASFVSKVLREQLKEHKTSTGSPAFGGKLKDFLRSETAAGPLWKKAAAANPALIIVYTPPGDYRNISRPGFKFDYAE